MGLSDGGKSFKMFSGIDTIPACDKQPASHLAVASRPARYAYLRRAVKIENSIKNKRNDRKERNIKLVHIETHINEVNKKVNKRKKIKINMHQNALSILYIKIIPTVAAYIYKKYMHESH